jgi:glyoxylase-like metal-dependent hydrolase (beta-lactamase superfamily II)
MLWFCGPENLDFDRSLDALYGKQVRLSPLVSRLLAPNPGPFTFKGTGVHIVDAGGQVAVIDPGPNLPEHIAALKAALGSRQLSHILVTHTHRDHCPAAAPLKAWSGAPIYGPPCSHAPMGQQSAVDEAHDPEFHPDIVVDDGMRIEGEGFGFECVATPGHTANHICFALAKERALFSGDHVMGWSTSVIAPPDGDMGQYLASLEKLLGRDEEIFYPTHGSPITAPKDWLRRLIDHRLMREAQILTTLAEEECDVAALTERLYPAIATALHGAAAQQIKAHLDHLAQKGAVVRTQTGYRPRT